MRTPLHGLTAPYTLPSNVIYFTDWRYVYSGGASWAMPDGTRVGPWHTDVPAEGYSYNPIDLPRGVRISSVLAERQSVNISRDKPWEYTFSISSLLHDRGRYRLWYSACPPEAIKDRNPNHSDVLCYAESDDGHNWTKPNVAPDGESNIVYRHCHGSAVFTDPHGYKMIYTGDVSDEQLARYEAARPDDCDPYAHRPDVNGKTFGVLGATSKDGLRWTALPDPLVIQHSDTQNCAYYDTSTGKYVAYLRTWYLGRRCVGRSETDDFAHFSFPQNILICDAGMDPADQWYTNARTTLPGAPDYHMMFPALYRQHTDTSLIVAHSSADGILWSRIPGPPVLDTARRGEPDGGCVFATREMVVLPDGRWALPYTGYDLPHKHPRYRPIGGMFYATWAPGRVAGVVADDEGEFSLMALAVDAKRIVLNMRGRVAVELAGRDGFSFDDADVIEGDHAGAAATWRGSDEVRLKKEEPVTIRFRLKKAELFSVRFE